MLVIIKMGQYLSYNYWIPPPKSQIWKGVWNSNMNEYEDFGIVHIEMKHESIKISIYFGKEDFPLEKRVKTGTLEMDEDGIYRGKIVEDYDNIQKILITCQLPKGGDGGVDKHNSYISGKYKCKNPEDKGEFIVYNISS